MFLLKRRLQSDPLYETQHNLFSCTKVILSSPVLNEGELESLLKDPLLKAQVLPTFFDIRKGVEGSIEKTLNRLCEAADEAVRNGSQLLVLSDQSDELVRFYYFDVYLSFILFFFFCKKQTQN